MIFEASSESPIVSLGGSKRFDLAVGDGLYAPPARNKKGSRVETQLPIKLGLAATRAVRRLDYYPTRLDDTGRATGDRDIN